MIQLSSTSLYFGSLSKGQTATRQVNIYNTDIVGVSITNIVSSSADYSIAPLSFVITPNSSKSIIISYTANVQASATGTVSIANTAGPDVTMSVSADVLEPVVDIDLGAISFGQLSVSDALVLTKNISNTATNGSILYVTISSTDSNFIPVSTSLAINCGETVGINIRFNPASSGVKSGTINLVTNDTVGSYSFNVSGEGVIPTYTVSTVSLDFGSIPIDSSKSMTFDVTNTSAVNLIVSSVSIGDSQFSIDVSGVTIPASQSQTFTVTFLPTTTAGVGPSITLSTNAGDIVVGCIGAGLVEPIIEITPSSVNLSTYSLNLDTAFAITIQNVGIVDVTISHIGFPTIAGTVFSLPITYPHIIGHGDSETFTVTVHSDSEATITGSISIVSDAYQSPHLIPIVGDAQSPTIIVDATVLDFGTIAIGGQSTLSFTISNTKDVDLSIHISSPHTFTVLQDTFIVSGNTSASINVTFALDVAGAVNETMVIHTNDIASPTVSLNLLGSANADHSFRLIPDKLTDDYISKGIVETTTLTIINLSLLQASINSFSFTSLSGVATYNVTVAGLPVVLDPGASVDLSVDILAASDGRVASDLKFNTSIGGANTSIVVRYEGQAFSPTVSLSSSSIDFGSVPIGTSQAQTVTISNSSHDADLSVNMSVSADAFYINRSLDEKLAVSYNGSKYVASAANQGLVLDTVTVANALTGEHYTLGDPANPSQFSVNTDSGIITVNSALSATSLDVSYDYKSGSVNYIVSKNSSLDISVGFSPTHIGLVAASMTVSSNDSVNPLLSISLQGTGIANVSSMVQDSQLVKFVAKVGGSISQKVVLKNTGTVKLHVTGVTILAPFSTSTAQFSIDPNETFDLDVTFQPTDAVEVHQDVVISSNAPDVTVSVVGQGAYPQMVLPTSFDFGPSPVNIATDKTLTIANVGAVDMNVELQMSSQYFSINPSTLSVVANSSYDITVTFKPTAIASYSEFVKILSDDPAQLQVNFNVAGQGVNKPVIETVSRLEFDETNVKQMSQKMLQVFNRGSADLDISNVSVTENLKSFSVKSATFATVAPGASTQFTIVFSPQSAPGDFITGKLVVLNNDMSHPSVEVLLKGKGNRPEGEWQAFNLSDMMPDALLSAANTIDDIISPLKTILGLVRQVFNLIKVLIIDTPSALTAILDKIFKVLENYVSDMLGTGLYILPVLPSSTYYDPDNNASNFAKFLASVGGGSDKFKQRIDDSFDDMFDSQRPQFSDTAFCGAFVIAVDSGNISEVIKGCSALKKIFTSLQWQPDVQEPQALQAVSGTSIILRWELPEFITFNVAGIFNSQKFIDIISGFEVYRSEEQSRLVTATEEHRDPNNQTVILSKVGDVIDVTTSIKQSPLPFVKASSFKFRFDNFAVGWKNADQKDISRQLGYEFADNDPALKTGKSYYYVVRSKLGDVYSKLSNEVVGVKITVTNPTTGIKFLNRCLNLRCIHSKASIKIVSPLLKPTVKLVNRTGIVIKAESRYNKNGVIPDANEQQVNTFTDKILGVHVSINDLIIRNPTAAERRIVKDKLNVDTSLFFNDGMTLAWDDNSTSAANKAEYFRILNDTRLVSGWDLMVNYVGNDTVITISDISNAGYLEGDYTVIEYYTNDYTVSCAKQMTPYDTATGTGIFKPADCATGTNKTRCHLYANARCIYHGGTACLNVGNTSLGNRCIPNTVFFDVDRCQDASMGGQVRAIDKGRRNDPNYCIETTGVCAGYQSLDEQSVGLYPNWTSLAAAMGLIKPVEDFIKTMQSWVEREIDAVQKGSQTVTQFIDLLSSKIDELGKFIDTIQRMISTMRDIFSSDVGFYILSIDPATGGSQRIRQIIRSAEGGPSSGSDGYTAGLVLFVGSTDGSEVSKTYQFLRLFFK